VVPKVWIETQTKVEKGKKVGRAESSKTGAVYFQRYVSLSVSVCSIGNREKGMANIKNELSNLLPKIIHTIVVFSYFF